MVPERFRRLVVSLPMRAGNGLVRYSLNSLNCLVVSLPMRAGKERKELFAC